MVLQLIVLQKSIKKIRGLKKNKNIRLKAYNTLLENKELSLIRKIKSELGEVRFPEIKSKDDLNLELITRQYYTILFGKVRLEKEILSSLGKNKSIKFFPLHHKHCKILLNNGIKVSIFWTKITFWLVMLLIWFVSTLLFIKTILKPKGIKSEEVDHKPFIYFDGLKQNNLPDFYLDGSSYDIITWYINSQKPDTKQIFHSVFNSTEINYKGFKINSTNGPLPLPKSYYKLIISSFKIIFKSLKNLFRGEWWGAFLLNEFLKGNTFDLANKDQIAEEYLFYDSESIYRPLWTYKAENFGAKIILYSYSTNERIKPAYAEEKNSDYINLMSWQEYWVWDNFQSTLLKENLHENIKTKIVGPINFSSKAIEIDSDDKSIIAIFDSPPHKKSEFFSFSTAQEYGFNKSEVHIKFINDILDVFGENTEVHFYFKVKRKRNKNLDVYSYINYLDNIKKRKNFHILDGDISASYLIEKSNLIISFPFTSTGVIAKLKNKKSIYYDPTGKLSKEDKAAHGVPIITNKKELEKSLLEINIFN